MRRKLLAGLAAAALAAALPTRSGAAYGTNYGRRLIQSMRTEREGRDRARENRVQERTVAIVAVDNRADDPEATALVVRTVAAHLKATRWRVLDPTLTLRRVEKEGFPHLRSRRRLRYLSRVLRADVLLRIVVERFTVSSLRREYEELLQTGHFTCADKEFAEVRVRLVAYRASKNDVVWKREDRQYAEYPFVPGKTNRDGILLSLLQRTVGNVLTGF